MTDTLQALAFDPSLLGLSLSFGVEVFTPGHKTPLHIHNIGHELFFVLSGESVCNCADWLCADVTHFWIHISAQRNMSMVG